MEFFQRFSKKLSSYSSLDESRAWLDSSWKRIKETFSNVKLRDFIFEPIKGVFTTNGNDNESVIRQTITMVSVSNAVMAGLPGKMGVGVAVSIALEGWMAFVIAKRVGVSIKSVGDIWKYFSLLAAITGTILYGIKTLLGFAFSLFSVIPELNPLILAELFITNLVGVLFWIGFEEAKATGSFRVPTRALKRIGIETKELTHFQWNIIKNNLSPSALKQVGIRLKTWLLGEIPLDHSVLRGEILPAVMMARILASEEQLMEGPLGQEFMEAIRDRFPALSNANFQEISDHMSTYDPEQLFGVMNVVKGKLFERLVAHYENQDHDHWQAILHDDESYPGSDITFVNDETGQSLEVSLKATDNPAYIESSLLRYPDVPILTTEEVSYYFADDSRVSSAKMTNEELNQVNQENFEVMLEKLSSVDVAEGAATGVAAGTAIGLWPFVVAYLKKRISHEQLETAFVRVLGEAGISLASRVSYAVLLGPIFAWYMLARGVMKLTQTTQINASLNTAHLQWKV